MQHFNTYLDWRMMDSILSTYLSFTSFSLRWWPRASNEYMHDLYCISLFLLLSSRSCNEIEFHSISKYLFLSTHVSMFFLFKVGWHDKRVQHLQKKSIHSCNVSCYIILNYSYFCSWQKFKMNCNNINIRDL